MKLWHNASQILQATGDVGSEKLKRSAGFAIATRVKRALRDEGFTVPGSVVAALVGGGGNGDDALYALAELARRGVATRALLVGEQAERPALKELRRQPTARIAAAGEADDVEFLAAAGIWIDGIAGVGASGPLHAEVGLLLSGLAAEIYTWPAPPTIVALDVPTGLLSPGPFEGLRADLTLCLGARCEVILERPEECGLVELIELSQALPLGEPTTIQLEHHDTGDYLPQPDAQSHKYNRGVVALAAGSESYPGAAFLCAEGAWDIHPGMVVANVPETYQASYIARFPQTLLSEGTWDKHIDAVVVGPGRRSDRLGAEVDAALAQAEQGTAVVLDAEALAHVTTCRGPVLLTPHEGELWRLAKRLGVNAPTRRELAGQVARATGAVVLAKGNITFAATANGEIFASIPGEPYLAQAGSGDRLAGTIGAMAAIARPSSQSELARIAIAATNLRSERAEPANAKASQK